MSVQPIDAASVDVCSLWASPEDAFDCCVELTDSDLMRMEWALAQASDLLYHLSGQRFPGTCTAKVRPIGSNQCWSRWNGWGVGDSGLSLWHADDCCCNRLSKIRLAGYPVQEITSVVIDGVTLDPSEYTLYYQRELVRMADANGRRQTWPHCQRLDIASGAGTFFVSYKYGLSPPVEGVAAAAQLACEIAKQCPGMLPDGEGDCALPAGTVRISRQGLTIDTQALGVWLLGQLKTGLPFVDAFLSVHGGSPRTRRTALMTPEMSPWPVRVE